MTRRLSGSVHILAAILLLTLADAVAGEDIAAVQARVMARGLASMEAGETEEAYARFSALVAADPSDAVALLWQARAALATGRHDIAKRNFDALLAAFPDHLVLRREAFEAFTAMDDADRLAALPTPPDKPWRELLVEETVREFAASAAGTAWDAPRPRPVSFAPQTTSLTRFTGRISAGVLYDSNVNQGNGTGWMRLGDFLVNVDDREKIGSAGAYLGAYFGFSRRLSELSSWAVVGDLGVHVRGYARSVLDDSDNREWQSGRVSAGVAYASGDNYFEARAKFQVFDYEFKNRVFASGIDLAYVRALNECVHLISRGGLDWRDYHHTNYRDGVYGNVGQSVRFFFGGDMERRHVLTLGATYYGSAADEKMYRYHAGEASARLDLRLPCRFTVSPNLAYAVEKYRGPGTVMEFKKRRDNRFRAGIDMLYEINESWSLEAYYAYTRNDSKSPLFDYNQHVVGAGMSWGF